MTMAAITTKNQLTLPKDVRTRLGVGAGDSVVFEAQPDGSFSIRARKARHWRELAGSLNHLLKPKQKAATVEEMDKAIGAHLAEDDRRISRGKE